MCIVYLSACNITRVVPEGEQLLVQNKIVRLEMKNIDLSDEKLGLRQRPNRKLFGFVKFHLWSYQFGTKGLGIRKKQSKLRKLAQRIGEAPVLIDSSKMEISAQRLSDYYFSKGFLENEVTYQVVAKNRKKRAQVEYHVDLKTYHTINTLQYTTSSMEIEKLLKESYNRQHLKLGKRLDFDNIEKERDRITALLRNNGFYHFNASYIIFQVDTNQNKLLADVVVNINDRKNRVPHYKQRINKVTVQIGEDAGVAVDTSSGIFFIEGSYYIKPYILARNINFRPGDVYNASAVQKTYSNLLSMGLFNLVTIRFYPSETDSLSGLEARIELRTAPKHDFVWEPQAILTGQSEGVKLQQNNIFGSEQSVGLANVFSLKNRNVFGGAETFNLSSLAAIESQIKKDSVGLVSSFRQSFNTEIVIPSLIFFERNKISKSLTRKSTKINASYLHDRNVNFTRNVVPFSLTYAFTKNQMSFGITPFRLSVNQATIDGDFLNSLDPAVRNYTTQLLTNNIISGPSATVVWNNKNKDPLKFWSVRSNAFELSGNLASAYFNLFTDQVGINKEIFDVKYSQYVRSDIDVVHNHTIDENNAIVWKAYMGAGYPYGNTVFLPFERRFFVGGGNSLRAWRPRTIGPGSYSDSSSVISIEKTGEFIIQGNLEYRFDIIDKYLDGALFLDAGNIWNFRERAGFENANFEWNRFYKELAINSGVGMRFNLTYVVFRADWGIALHDPSKADEKRWVIKDFSQEGWVKDNTAINFAIGFPF